MHKSFIPSAGFAGTLLAMALAHAAPAPGAAAHTHISPQVGPAISAAIPQPHLAVAYPFAHSPAPTTAGDNVTLMIRVENTGTANAAQGAYQLWVDCKNLDPAGAACPFSKNSRSLPAIAAGENGGVTLLTQPWPAVDFRIFAWVQKTGDTGPLGHRPWSTQISVAPKPPSALQLKRGIPAVGGHPGPQPEPVGSQARSVKPGSYRGVNPQTELQ